MAFVEIPFYSLNIFIGGMMFRTTDIGGSMFIHLFGAYFGLVVARISGAPKLIKKHPKNAETYKSDVFSMIGTVFLWMFWPSFNGGTATGSQQQRVIINTMLSLAASCFVVIVLSQRLRGKFKMVDIQNATLAGGVAIGASANLIIQPWGALLIGVVAGTVSILGFVFVQPFLEDKIGLYDTAGIHNLHGMPSILGSLACIFAVLAISTTTYGSTPIIGQHIAAMGNASFLPLSAQNKSFDIQQSDRSPSQQASWQAAAMALTLGMALFSGTLTGFLIRLKICDPPRPEYYFDDLEYFEVPARVVVEAQGGGDENVPSPSMVGMDDPVSEDEESVNAFQEEKMEKIDKKASESKSASD